MRVMRPQQRPKFRFSYPHNLTKFNSSVKSKLRNKRIIRKIIIYVCGKRTLKCYTTLKFTKPKPRVGHLKETSGHQYSIYLLYDHTIYKIIKYLIHKFVQYLWVVVHIKRMSLFS
jgi:hypothetical protein